MYNNKTVCLTLAKLLMLVCISGITRFILHSKMWIKLPAEDLRAHDGRQDVGRQSNSVRAESNIDVNDSSLWCYRLMYLSRQLQLHYPINWRTTLRLKSLPDSQLHEGPTSLAATANYPRKLHFIPLLIRKDTQSYALFTFVNRPCACAALSS